MSPIFLRFGKMMSWHLGITHLNTIKNATQERTLGGIFVFNFAFLMQVSRADGFLIQ